MQAKRAPLLRASLRRVSEHYFTPRPGKNGELGELHDVQVKARGQEFSLKASDRVFSQDHLDIGTHQLLIRSPRLPKAGTFLDLGCGWGPLALMMAAEAPEASVWATDVNERALALTRLNADLLGFTNVYVVQADAAYDEALAKEVRFDVIWSNPPIRIGKPALREMLLRWLALLTPEGHAYLVVNRHLGADSLASWLNTKGYVSQKVASRKGFRILEVHKG